MYFYQNNSTWSICGTSYAILICVRNKLHCQRFWLHIAFTVALNATPAKRRTTKIYTGQERAMTACLPSDSCIPTRLPRSAKLDRLAMRLPRGEKIPISASLYDVPTNALPNVKEKRTPIVPCLSMSKMPMPPVPVVIVGTGANGAIYSVKGPKKTLQLHN